MIRFLRDLRLIPIVLVATGCLFALKLIGLVFDGSYLLGSRNVPRNNIITVQLAPASQELIPQTVPLESDQPPAGAKQSWMREMFGYPDATGSAGAPPAARPINPIDVTGSTPAPPKPPPKEAGPGEKAAAPAPPNGKPTPPETKPAFVNGVAVPLDGPRQVSPAERAILERLHERRQELEKRERELEMRENMVKEAEQRLEARAQQIKELEAKGGVGGQKKEEAETARMKNLASMYENMKAKDAAKIFDRLDIKILIDMTALINPRRMSEILANMNPEAAERLTSELASRAGGPERAPNPASLPKIEGRPSGS